MTANPIPFFPDNEHVSQVDTLLRSCEKNLGTIGKFRKDVYLLHFAPCHGEQLYKEVYAQAEIEKLGLKVNDEKFQAPQQEDRTVATNEERQAHLGPILQG